MVTVNILSSDEGTEQVGVNYTTVKMYCKNVM